MSTVRLYFEVLEWSKWTEIDSFLLNISCNEHKAGIWDYKHLCHQSLVQTVQFQIQFLIIFQRIRHLKDSPLSGDIHIHVSTMIFFQNWPLKNKKAPNCYQNSAFSLIQINVQLFFKGYVNLRQSCAALWRWWIQFSAYGFAILGLLSPQWRLFLH